MMPVHHAGNSIKPESIQLIFLQPVSAVGQQKPQHRPFSIIEAPGIPCGVLSLRTVMKILIQGSVKPAETFHLIGDRMGMNDIHQHPQSISMSGIDEFPEIVRSSKSG